MVSPGAVSLTHGVTPWTYIPFDWLFQNQDHKSHYKFIILILLVYHYLHHCFCVLLNFFGNRIEQTTGRIQMQIKINVLHHIDKYTQIKINLTK